MDQPLNVLRRATVRMVALIAAAIAMGAGVANAQEDEGLTLRVQDAAGAPGRIVALVLRTYSSRGVGQGQVCLALRQRAKAGAPEVPGGADPVAELVGSVVFSAAGDAQYSADLLNDGQQQMLLVSFSSPTDSINAIDGPLAVVYLRLREQLLPDTDFEVSVDLPDTFLIGEDGQRIPITGSDGRLRVDPPNEPLSLAAAAEATRPGRLALLSMQTRQLELLGGGRMGFRYDVAIASGPPLIRIDPRYGSARFDESASDFARGLVVVAFTSPRRDLNRVPGDLIQMYLPTRADIPVGLRSPVSLVPDLTVLTDRAGNVLPLAIENGFIEFTP